MCGRYFLKQTPEKLKEIFGTENSASFLSFLNGCPTQNLPVIVRGKTNSFSRMGLARWGLLPSHASHDDVALCAKMKNARMQTLREKISFASLWEKGRRCIIPASGFYEWPEEKVKGQPGFEISHESEVIAFAGLWNRHEDLITFTIITGAASESVAGIHSRMPMAFTPEKAREWLACESDYAYPMMQNEHIRDWKISKMDKPISLQNAQPVLV